MKCLDAETCTLMAHKVQRAIGVGELLEDQIAGRGPGSIHAGASSVGSRPIDEWVSRQLASLKRRLVGSGKPAVSVSQSFKMAQFADDFRAAIEELPDEVDIELVGAFPVVRSDSRSHANTWAGRCRARRDVHVVFNEIKLALADLVTARSRLELGATRLRTRN